MGGNFGMGVRASILKPTSIFNKYTLLPGRVAQSITCLATDASLTADPGVVS